MRYYAESRPNIHQKTLARNLIQHVNQKSRGDGVRPDELQVATHLLGLRWKS
jgi:hypothetical protein